MAVIGAMTRLTQSGLSMVEWRPLIGALPPLSQADWQALFGEYQRSPEYRQLHGWMSLADFQGIFWWEYVHRLWGRLIGLAFAGPFVYFLMRGRLPRRLVPGLAGVLALGALEGGVGWWMVASGLLDDPHVSHYRLATHLGIAVAIYGALLWTALGVWEEPRTAAQHGLLRAAGVALIALIFLAILSGALVAGLHAGLVYNSFPLMEGEVVPRDYLARGRSLDAILSNPAAVQFNHRALALISVGAALVFARTVRRRATVARPQASMLAAMALLQAGLGVATLLLVVPIPLAALHQAGALVLFGLAIWVARRLG